MTEKRRTTRAKAEDNGQGDELKDMLQVIISNQTVLSERMDEVEEGRSKDSEALLQMVNIIFNTDDQHLPELTRIPLPSARPFAYSMGLGSLLEAREKGVTTSLSQRITNNYFRLMRSVGGVHLGRGTHLAEEQAAAVAEKAEEFELGGD